MDTHSIQPKGEHGLGCSSVVEHLPRDRAQVLFPVIGQMDGWTDRRTDGWSRKYVGYWELGGGTHLIP